MMRTRIAVVAAAAALLFTAAAFAGAQEWHAGGPHQLQAGGPPPPPPHPPMPFGVPEIEHLSRMLGLTDAQAAELKTFFEAQEPTFESIHRRLEESHRQLEAATADGRFDEAQVRALAGQQGQAHADMVVEHERCKAKVYSVLTPEQRVRLEELHHGHHGIRLRAPGGPR
jgi:Spy/CpxP family protein refolding chaperone